MMIMYRVLCVVNVHPLSVAAACNVASVYCAVDATKLNQQYLEDFF